MIENIRASMQQIIDKAPWLDGEGKQEASEKLKKMTSAVAYPDYIMSPNDEKMDNYYMNITMDLDTYFENVQSMLFLQSNHYFNLLHTKPDPEG